MNRFASHLFKRASALTSGCVLALALISLPQSANATARTWNNLGTDWNTTANWNGGAPTASGAVGQFTNAESVQPNLSASVSIAGIYFSGTGSSGYDITSTAGATFTLLGTGSTGSGGTSNSNAAAVRSEVASGSNTVDSPLILGAAAASTQVFFQASGGTLIVNGPVSNTNALTSLDLKGTGTIQLNGSNTSLNIPVRINDAGTTLQVGNDSALGSAAFTFNTSGSIQAGGGTRTIDNAINFAIGTPTVSGTNDIIFNGTVTNSGGASRNVTINNTGNTTFAGSVFLAGDNTTGRTVTFGGSGAATISGVVANNNAGNTVSSSLAYNGTNTLTLSNANTYTGTTSVSNGTLLINGNQSAATGNVASNFGTTGGTLGGIGTIGGATTVNAGANITGGTSGGIGTLNLGSSLTFTSVGPSLSAYLVDIGGTTSDKLAITGALDLSGTFDQISFNQLGALTGTSYTLATYASETGTFDTVTNLPVNYSLVYNPTELDLVQAAVPEPSTWIAGTLVAFALLATQRRRFLKPAAVKA